MDFLDQLAARRRFGMRPGLDAIRKVCAALGDPQKGLRAIHVAGTNGKGAVCAILDACLRAARCRTGRYTSPHLVRLNERFFLDGKALDDVTLSRAAARVAQVAPEELTFFEALTAVAFLVYAEVKPDFAVLETGLGGRLDATNICEPTLCVITRIGLDHCDWLGGTLGAIASEKAGIVKPGVPVVLGANEPEVVDIVAARAKEVGAPFVFAPDIVSPGEVGDAFALSGAFNRENAVTALAALKVLGKGERTGLADVVWPGRFQRVGEFIVDGAHNPCAARALAASLAAEGRRHALVAGFCADKDADAILSILAPFVTRGYGVCTKNPRSLSAAATTEKMRAAGIDVASAASLEEAIAACRGEGAVICGSLFLAGEALVALGAWSDEEVRFDSSELLRGEG